MYEESKSKIICPRCGGRALIGGLTRFRANDHYVCEDCGWDSDDCDENDEYLCVDIAYKDDSSSTLSNLFPHNFDFYTKTGVGSDLTHCLSMESFLQSLKIPDAALQKEFCENYSGYASYKARLSLPEWRNKQLLYWNGKGYRRSGKKYSELITMAYDRLFYGNNIFREIVLPQFRGKFLIHSIGKTDTTESVLTEKEYLYQLNRLMSKLENS